MTSTGKPCPVAKECSMMRAMATSGSSSMPSSPSSIPSSLPSSFFENPFYDSLLNFMLECSKVVEETHRRTGRRELTMTPEERQVRIQELMNRIAEKERELSQLEEERRNMLSNYDASISSGGTGPAFTPPGRARLPRGSERRTPRSPYQHSQDESPCIPACAAACNADADGAETSFQARLPRRTPRSPYQHSQDESPCIPGCAAECSFDASGAETSFQLHRPWQRRVMSTPTKRSSRPPAFDTSGYNTSSGPGGCDPNCTDPCHTMDDSTMAQWHRRLM